MAFQPIFYILGWLLAAFGATMLIPAALDGFLDQSGVRHFMWSAGIAGFLGTLLIFMNRTPNRNLNHRDGFLLTALTWFSLSLIGALPFYISGIAPTFIDALFESTSGLTTTGASVLTGLDTMDKGILLWRAMLQWLGGMGIIVLAIAILPFLGIGGMQLYRSEMPGVVKDKLQPRLKDTAKILWVVYLIITLSCVLAYLLAGMPLFDAVCHAFTTVATGGFSTRDASIGAFNNPTVEWVCISFMVLGAINFALHFLLVIGRSFTIYLKNPEAQIFLLILFSASVLTITTLVANEVYPSMEENVRNAIFNIVSIFTTTGYSTTNYAAWPAGFLILVFLLMFCGGCSGSTSGGVKVMRFMMISQQGASALRRLLHPRAVVHLKIGGQTIPPEVLESVWSFVALYTLCFLGIALLLGTWGVDFLTAISAAGATLTGLGPGLGEVGPSSTYVGLPQIGKLLLCFSMLIGRLEVFTILILFMPSYWRP